METLEENKTTVSSHHSGDMEGNAVCELMRMEHGYLPHSKKKIIKFRSNGATAANNEMYASSNKIKMVFSDYAKLLLLIDAVFSLLNIERGEVMTDVVTTLKEEL